MTTPKRAVFFQSQRAVIGLLLLTMIGLAWAYLIWMTSSMSISTSSRMGHHVLMPTMGSPHGVPIHFWWLFVMWAVMSVAMMLPTALPMVMLFNRFWRGRYPAVDPVKPTLLLVSGYLGVWVSFGFAASLFQFWLEHTQMITPVMGKLKNPLAGGLVLAGAGVFQLTPLKTACLSKCRTPMMYLNTSWREGRLGSFLMGLNHGAFCLGCCWALMLVMFVTGVMNLFWMAVLATLMLAEKIVPNGLIFARITGWTMISCGVFMIFS